MITRWRPLGICLAVALGVGVISGCPGAAKVGPKVFRQAKKVGKATKFLDDVAKPRSAPNRPITRPSSSDRPKYPPFKFRRRYQHEEDEE